MSGFVRSILIAAGCVALALGIGGVFLPVLPTTPFLLLAAACFARSSERLHAWLVGHRRLGPYIDGFIYGGGISPRAQRRSVAALWATIALSSALSAWRGSTPALRLGVPLLLLAVAVSVSAYILSRPTREDARQVRDVP